MTRDEAVAAAVAMATEAWRYFMRPSGGDTARSVAASRLAAAWAAIAGVMAEPLGEPSVSAPSVFLPPNSAGPLCEPPNSAVPGMTTVWANTGGDEWSSLPETRLGEGSFAGWMHTVGYGRLDEEVPE